ncbi:hypothetical protein KL933_001564 [Ogataea haglerorum]|uniref:DUF4110 domain-containing protein n=1 Tax=Ogataea haglerorum TaxID=1937702 RepID=A0AAN6D7V8_9ASCO|nr:hypothetical protein KL951_002603 [Ogataea haglerorum]KAG7709778.1 hypothetical protein KL950_001997 [Ogataea haglerorum]KAG7729338.1 hypothetical protein KL933_001564 [Ogataea haglerorum]KAG7732082.1 hypothetical protein KL948_002280 [Ogataea haglerorum]KAG7748826.1 hypothetical protein KL912_001888 [Ogataea haglerorum]
MAKKDKKSKEAKKARIAQKNEKNAKKAGEKLKKLSKKAGDNLEDDVDLDELLKQLALEQQEFEEVHVEVIDRPLKRLNATFAASNTNGRRELILFGGEVNTGQTVHFYNDLNVFSVDSKTWRRYMSKNSPLPRSSHAMCYHPSGIFVMHGGEFSSPKQSTFHHFSDTWILDSQTKEWAKVDGKGPPNRSGHRMACWKNYVMLFGGFRDLGSHTTYLNDLWLFDITTYKWKQVEFPATHSIPDPRSGHSFMATEFGAILYGGYCKVKAGKGLQKGKILTDCWALNMKSDPAQIRFERRRKQGFQPSPRVGCSMQYHKGRGMLFGGVFDYEETEETLDSEFYNTLLSYNVETNRWSNLSLRSSKKKATAKKEKVDKTRELEEMLNSILAKHNLADDEDYETPVAEEDEEEPEETLEIRNQLPHARFNALTCVVDDTLYLYGGMYEAGEQEFNLDSFYSIDLSKLDGVRVFWEDLSELERQEAEESDDESDDEDEDDEEEQEKQVLVAEEEEEEPEEEEEEEAEIPDEHPWLPHPKAFESLRAFYLRTGPDFLTWAISQNPDTRGKYLKTKAFALCETRWWERREAVQLEEESLEESGVTDVIEKDFSKGQKRR